MDFVVGIILCCVYIIATLIALSALSRRIDDVNKEVERHDKELKKFATWKNNIDDLR